MFIIKSFIDNDTYKFTMSQLVYFMEKIIGNPTVEYRLTNRDYKNGFILGNFVDLKNLKEEVDNIINLSPSDDELTYLESLTTSSFYRSEPIKLFKPEFLDFLSKFKNPKIFYKLTQDRSGEIDFSFWGNWKEAIFYEVPFMSVISELYVKYILNRLDSRLQDEVWKHAEKRLDSKLSLALVNRSLRFSDFGTRRRAGIDWHDRVIERLRDVNEKYHFGGTSNLYFAKKYGLRPIGTFAHELPMVLAALCSQMPNRNETDAYPLIFKEWTRLYKTSLSICLTDTFTTKWLFDTYGMELVNIFEGVRHDSGDPFKFGDEYIDLCKRNKIDPMNRVIVFSDGLDFEKMIELLEYFRNRVWVTFGIGTNLTNDIGIKPLNIVIKAVSANNIGTVKLSDNPNKNSGTKENIQKYKEIFMR